MKASVQPDMTISMPAYALLAENLQQAVLIETADRTILLVNQPFCDLFQIPAAPELLRGADCSNAAESVKQLFLKPEEFVSRIVQLVHDRKKCVGETLRLCDGRVLLRDFIPVWKEGVYDGHIWTYTDITGHIHTEELEIQQTVNFFLSSLYNKETVEDILWDVAKNCIGRLAFEDCVIYLMDETGTGLEQKAAWGPKTIEDNRIISPIRIPLGEGIVGAVALHGQAEIVNDTSADPRYILDDQFRLSEISVPIIHEGKVLGVIDSEHPEKNFFTGKHLSILSTIASLCAIKMVQFESAIRQRQEIDRQKLFYEQILNNIPADIAVFDTSHHYLFVNPTGIKSPELRQWIIGKKDEDYCDLRNKPYSVFKGRRDSFNKAVQSRTQIEWEEPLTDPAGHVSFHLRKFFPVLNNQGEPELVIGYGLNITERKMIENKIRESEKKYRDLFNNSPALILTHDMQYRITSVNAAVKNVLGYTVDEITGKALHEIVDDQEAGGILQQYITDIATQTQLNVLVPARNAGGDKIHLLYHAYKVETGADEPYVILFGQDISERIRIEEDLQRAKLASEQNAQAKESFLAKVSHEIRTPMNGILGVADLLSRTNTDEQQNRYINVLRLSAQNLLAIVNDVLDIEKILAGKMLLEHIPFDLSRTLELLRDIFASEAERRQNRFVIDNTLDSTLQFMGDPFRISQVLTNLLSNAVKFTSNGLVRLQVSAVNEDDETMILGFRVEDSGIGIPADKLQEIFEPFSQVDFTARAGLLGTGLGLTICREIAVLMKGDITVESQEGRGSVFTFELPLKKLQSPAIARDVTIKDNRKLDGRRILLVEDIELNRFVVQEMTKDWKLVLDMAMNGREAVAMAGQVKYDLILMDIQMPEMNGVEATRAIRDNTDSPNQHTPIIALSANAFETDKASYFSAGMDAVLSKPFVADTLFSVLADCLYPERNKAKPIVMKSEDNKHPVQVDLTYLLELGKNNRAFVGMMLKSFRETAEEITGEMEEALQASDWERSARLIHKMKFALSVIGAGSLQSEIKWLEARTRNPEAEYAEQLPVRVGAFIATVKELQAQVIRLIESGEWQ